MAHLRDLLWWLLLAGLLTRVELSLAVAIAALVVASASMLIGAGAAVRTAELQRQTIGMRYPTGPSGLPTGAPVPDVTTKDLHGNAVDWPALKRGPTLLVVSNPDCPPCNELTATLPTFVANHPHWTTAVLATGTEEAVRARYAQLTTLVMRLEDAPEAEGFRSALTPYAFVIEEGNIRHQGGANTLDQLERLIERARQRALTEAPAA